MLIKTSFKNNFFSGLHYISVPALFCTFCNLYLYISLNVFEHYYVYFIYIIFYRAC